MCLLSVPLPPFLPLKMFWFGYNNIFPTKATLSGPLMLSDLVLLKPQSLAAASALLLPVLRAIPTKSPGYQLPAAF